MSRRLWPDSSCRMPSQTAAEAGKVSRKPSAKSAYTCAVKRRWSTAGESPARELGSLHPVAIGAAVEETKPSEPPVYASLAERWRLAVLVMLSPLLVRMPRERFRDDAAGGLIGCAGSAREARRKWAQELADTREAETRQSLIHLMAPPAAEQPR